MCGIAGIHRARGTTVEEVVPMLDCLVHRGPDDAGVVSLGPAAVGIRRLAIVDVAGGHQPFVSDDGRVAVVGNGEIYNHLELRQELVARGHRFGSGSDMEVVLHLYEEYGAGFLSRLRGMFALAVADGRRGHLLLARDRLGLKPLYYARAHSGEVAFASEYRALRSLGLVSKEVDLQALRDQAAWGWIAPPRTGLADVRKLGPGQLLVAGPGGVEVRTWWERPVPGLGPPQGTEQGWLLDLLDQTVAAHLMSEVPLGVFLSGGLDSSAVAALASRHADGLSAFTVSFSGDADGADRHGARAVALQLGLDHKELVVDPAPRPVLEAVAAHHDEPVGDAACIPTYLMAQAASEHVTVVLTGEGADEAFGGYRKYEHLRLAASARRLPTSFRRGGLALARAGLGQRRASKLSAFLEAPPALAPLRYDEVFTEGERRQLFLDGSGGVEEPVPPNGVSDGDGALWVDAGWPLSEQLNMKVDKMTMAHSLEARVPFLDHVVFEAAARLPAASRRRKAVLREELQGLLPPEVLRRPKHGFTVPVSRWIRDELRSLASELLAGERLRRQGLWDPGVVGTWLAQHLEGRVDRGRQLWNLLAVQLWVDQMGA